MPTEKQAGGGVKAALLYCDNETLRLMAWRNYRGIKDDQLIFNLQEARQKLDDLDSCPEVFNPPLNVPQGEYVDHLKYFFEQSVASIEAEFTRRDKIQTCYRPADPRIIETIKSRLEIDEILAEYTEVFYNKGRITYRCTLHGTDSTPSGVIYKAEQRCWCHGCSKGGDVFDVVQAFERLSLPEAISKLARKLGLDTERISSNGNKGDSKGGSKKDEGKTWDV